MFDCSGSLIERDVSTNLSYLSISMVEELNKLSPWRDKD